MGLIPAITKIPARELSRRLVWLGAYLAYLNGTGGQAEAGEVAKQAVTDYEAQFPQS